MNIITARSNPAVVAASKLKDKKYRDESRLYITEGIKLFEEALSFSAPIEKIFVTEKIYNRLEVLHKRYDVYVVSESVFEKLSTEKSPEGIICIIRYDEKQHKKAIECTDAGTKFILCSVRDPGNVGTVIRSCAAFGTNTLILSSDCADIYNPKTVRAAMGALFRQKILISDNVLETVNWLQNNGTKVYAAMLDSNAVELDSINIDENICFAVGNEGRGIPKEIADICFGKAIIPMAPNAESLNAAVASSVLLWESYKQKRRKTNE
ncbi:MAG: RNA methyltransferase [Ruminococcaceae bacterium]|nr:RNA methyltransferase [Oscillospiraceae bacterium]